MNHVLANISLWFYAVLGGLLVVSVSAVLHMDKQIKKRKHDDIAKGKTFKVRLSED